MATTYSEKSIQPELMAALIRSADSLDLIASNLWFHTDQKIRTIAECAKACANEARAKAEGSK